MAPVLGVWVFFLGFKWPKLLGLEPTHLMHLRCLYYQGMKGFLLAIDEVGLFFDVLLAL